ncbi:Cullin repeat-like-containing domain protein [Trametes maxima]|nr:Cullin repeat-like-containing domain protein [Trametes maxima]
MQSLRSRKPSESRPKGAQRQGTVRVPKPAPRNAERRATRVGEKMKKRMSMRYADISAPTDASVPDVPAIPIGMRAAPYAQDMQRFTEEPKEDLRISELRLLDKDDFDPDAYLKLKLANSTEAELRSLQSSLQSQKDDVAVDLQKNVFKNYAEFMLVSKEVSTLENEMLEFKEALAEWKGMPSLLHIDDSASVAERRRNVRSSVADLRVLYANQMQTLHMQIEGSSKFVPTTPGRHVITEIDNVVSLNPATYKVDHSVRFVLLDDAVLVARKRKRRNNAENDKLVAERCWPLNEMLVLDTKDTPNMTNVFKIRHGKETHVYRTDISADKKNLLSQFRHVAEELAAKKRKEREGEHQRRKSMWMGGDRSSLAFNGEGIPPMPEWMADLASKSGELGATAKEKAESDARWIGDWSDELTVSIALREWDRAVTLVEEGESKVAIMPPLSAKLTPLKASLAAALLQSLAAPGNRKSTVVSLIGLLVRLKAGAAARSTFLAARADVIKKCVRKITFEGHIGAYIGDLATVVFTGIKHTADWFLASFNQNEAASSFVEWAKQQIELYAEMFRKQVFSTDVDPRTIDEAIQITHVQSKKLLEEYGIDFRFLLDNLLVESPRESSRPPPFRAHAEKAPEPIYTPASTPLDINTLTHPHTRTRGSASTLQPPTVGDALARRSNTSVRIPRAVFSVSDAIPGAPTSHRKCRLVPKPDPDE